MTENEAEDMDDIPKSVPVKKPVAAVEECDPLTMNCTEMPKVMETLIRKESILNEGIGRISELQRMFPSRKELTDLHDDAVRARAKIHGTISDITTRFSMCTLKQEEQEPENIPEPKEPEEPEEEEPEADETPV